MGVLLQKDVFPFTLELKVPEISEMQVVQGCLMYFPNESGDETLPETKRYGEDNTPDPMFECFWQGWLCPLVMCPFAMFLTSVPTLAEG